MNIQITSTNADDVYVGEFIEAGTDHYIKFLENGNIARLRKVPHQGGKSHYDYNSETIKYTRDSIYDSKSGYQILNKYNFKATGNTDFNFPSGQYYNGDYWILQEEKRVKVPGSLDSAEQFFKTASEMTAFENSEDWDWWVEAPFPIVNDAVFFENAKPAGDPEADTEEGVDVSNLSRTATYKYADNTASDHHGISALVTREFCPTDDPEDVDRGDEEEEQPPSDSWSGRAGSFPWAPLEEDWEWLHMASGDEEHRKLVGFAQDEFHFFALRELKTNGSSSSGWLKYIPSGLSDVKYFANGEWDGGNNSSGWHLATRPFDFNLHSDQSILSSGALDFEAEHECDGILGNIKKEVWKPQGIPETKEAILSGKPIDHRFPVLINGKFVRADTGSTQLRLNSYGDYWRLHFNGDLIQEFAMKEMRQKEYEKTGLKSAYTVSRSFEANTTDRLQAALAMTHEWVFIKNRGGYAFKSKGDGTIVESELPEGITITYVESPALKVPVGQIISDPPVVASTPDEIGLDTAIDTSNDVQVVGQFKSPSVVPDPPTSPETPSQSIALTIGGYNVQPPSPILILNCDTTVSDVPQAVTLFGGVPGLRPYILRDPPGATTILHSGVSTLSTPPGAVGVFQAIEDIDITDEEIACAVVNVRVIDELIPWEGKTMPSKYKGYVYDERISGLAGPFVNEDITAITNRSNTGEMIAVNRDLETLKTDLLDFNRQGYTKPLSLEAAYSSIETRVSTEGEKDCVVASKKGQGFSYRGLYLREPFSEPTTGSGFIVDPMYFRNSYMSVIETNWIHLGDEHNEKQVHRLDLSFHKNSFGALFGYVSNEEGMVKGQYKGEIKESMKVFTNLRGRRFKVKLLIVTHKNFPWALREMSIGHLYGKSF